MIKMFITFVVLVNYIMNQREILTAPITDAIIPSGVVDKPSVCGAFIFTIMKEIKLTQGQVTLVDDWNYDWLIQWKWHAMKSAGTYYAVRRDYQKHNGVRVWMHREIMKTPSNMKCDHANHNGLDNQECNLRTCTHQQNMMNKTAWGSSSYLGVSYRKDRNCYTSKIGFNERDINLGHFKREEDAARAYDAAAKKYFGEFANLNFK